MSGAGAEGIERVMVIKVLFKSLFTVRKMDLNFELDGTYSCIFNSIPSVD